MSAALAAIGHLVYLIGLGFAIGAAQTERGRRLGPRPHPRPGQRGLLPRVGGRPDRRLPVPPGADRRDDRPRLLPGARDRGQRAAVAAADAPDRQPGVKPRHPRGLQVRRLLPPRGPGRRRRAVAPAPAGRHLVSHLPVAVVHRRRLPPRDPRDPLGGRADDLRLVLPAARGRADRPRPRAPASALGPAAVRAHPRRRRPVPHPGRPGQEGRAGRLPRRRPGRSGVPAPRVVLVGRGRGRRGRVRVPDLPRLLGLQRHRDRLGPAPGLHAAGELPHAVSLPQPAGLLAALAHLAVLVAARLPVHPARRQSRRRAVDLSEPDPHHAPRRAVARRQLDVHRLGPAPRRRPGGHAPHPARDPAAAGAGDRQRDLRRRPDDRVSSGSSRASRGRTWPSPGSTACRCGRP
jgi:hypothetical protein